MPIRKIHKAGDFYQAGIFDISMPFGDLLALCADIPNVNSVLNASLPEKRKKEKLAEFILIQNLSGISNFELSCLESGKPILKGLVADISISHSRNLVAVQISNQIECGIDVQYFETKILRLYAKFLNAAEIEYIERLPEEKRTKILTLYWSSKEVLFKIYGKGFVDYLNLFDISDIANYPCEKINCKAMFDGIQRQFELEAKCFDEYVVVLNC